MNNDLISREALKEQINTMDFDFGNYYDETETIIKLVCDVIDNAPPVEITEEQAINKLLETGWLIGHDKEMTTRPQGEWIFKNGKYRCTACGEKAIYRYSGSLAITQTELLTQFCPNCGADMRIKENKDV